MAETSLSMPLALTSYFVHIFDRKPFLTQKDDSLFGFINDFKCVSREHAIVLKQRMEIFVKAKDK